ncbi:N-acetylmuramoyl-L-alanine amidase family protein [Clostridium sp. ZBS15]|uniref:N-acetylmuramoyl-L-alanine amidase family protein n=1 Tax=Clostridium sp. ZBS15 TaxID=2949969 RepID=UPI00207B0890|nr:N-acetylmuramoyl-L-alanine amidase family protein [Clostridium sp. ZBS15]
MIKRIKKVMALVLIATSMVAIAPRDMFKGNVTAYAATTKEGMPSKEELINQMLGKLNPSKKQIEKNISNKLTEEYKEKGAVYTQLIYLYDLDYKISEKDAQIIAKPIATKKANELLKIGLIKPEELKSTIDLITNQLVIILTQPIPIYEYISVNASKEPVGTGFIIGGSIANIFLESKGKLIYIKDSDLSEEGIKQKLQELLSKIDLSGPIGQIMGNISSTITGALDDVADSVDKVSNSITDLFDDLDDSTDDFFDKINKDEGWDKHDGYIYYYDEDGIKYRGVHEIKGKNYYFNRIDGAMETGWQIVDGKRCYFLPKKGYQLYSQWIKDGDKIYCLDEKGEVRKSQWAQDGANSCYLKADGTLAKGWYSVNRDERYYFNETTGYIETSKWIYDDQEWYYLKDSGVAATDWECINGKWYCFKSTGKMYSGWFRNEGSWYYSDSTGAMQTGWVSHKNKWFYLDESGKMKKNEWVSVNGNWYYFNLNGEMITSSRYIDGTKYHFNSDGSLQS